MKQAHLKRLERLEAEPATQYPAGRHILVEVHTLSAVEAQQRIAEANAEKEPGDLLIIVDRVCDLSYLEGV